MVWRGAVGESRLERPVNSRQKRWEDVRATSRQVLPTREENNLSTFSSSSSSAGAPSLLSRISPFFATSDNEDSDNATTQSDDDSAGQGYNRSSPSNFLRHTPPPPTPLNADAADAARNQRFQHDVDERPTTSMLQNVLDSPLPLPDLLRSDNGYYIPPPSPGPPPPVDETPYNLRRRNPTPLPEDMEVEEGSSEEEDERNLEPFPVPNGNMYDSGFAALHPALAYECAIRYARRDSPERPYIQDRYFDHFGDYGIIESHPFNLYKAGHKFGRAPPEIWARPMRSPSPPPSPV
ncbi:hypothetical protein JCM11641_001852 [Rhodosporidiobolus odoratus]